MKYTTFNKVIYGLLCPPFIRNKVKKIFKKILISLLVNDKEINSVMKKVIRENQHYTYYETLAKKVTKGKHSYLGDYATVASPKTTIGAFCSIADNVSIGTTHHPMHYLSTHPFCYFEPMKLSNSSIQYPYDYNTPVTIGNDVWIGKNVIIMDGITIGDGAIIGANAVVTHDVPSYAVIAGVPAKILRYRFDKKTIQDLIDLKWWDFDDKDIEKLKFNDISCCIEEIKKIRRSN